MKKKVNNISFLKGNDILFQSKNLLKYLKKKKNLIDNKLILIVLKNISKRKLTKTPNTIKGQNTIKTIWNTFVKKMISISFENIDDAFFFEQLRDYSYEKK